MSPADIETARRLVATSKAATLSTLTAKGDRSPSYPFGSLVAVANDDRRAPILLLSSLAEHTKNLVSCPRSSLLFADATAGDPLANARVTLLGDIHLVQETEIGRARTAYLARHPEAGTWAGFKDFAFYVMTISEIRIVIGFGKMGWIDVADYLGA